MTITVEQDHLALVHRAKGAAAEAAFGAALRETGDLGVATAARDGARFAVRDFMLGTTCSTCGTERVPISDGFGCPEPECPESVE